MDRAVVLKNVASLRLKPGYDSELADEVLHGMVVELVETVSDPWYKVRTGYDYYGYIHKDDISIDGKRAEKWQSCDYIVWNLITDVMSEPKYGSRVAATLVRGCLVEYTGINEDKWEKVGLADGSWGWIRGGFAKKVQKPSGAEEEDKLRSRIVSAALDYLGTQYRWGGKSPFGIDCSGLSGMAYMVNGLLIPRDAGPQQQYMKAINREEAKPGDLFFFPGHVAVCIGDGRYVHATGREGSTVINSFNIGSDEYREDLDKNQTGTGSIF